MEANFPRKESVDVGKSPAQKGEMMSPLNFTLAQIEAFACVCETGTLTHAARKLRKDRTTVSELVAYLEADLGYPLFERAGRSLTLTEAGERLWRQSRLFLHEAQSFAQLARQIPQQLSTRLTLCYDAFTPRDFLLRLGALLKNRQIQLEPVLCERVSAENWLEQSRADVGVFQAMNRSINDSLHWRAIGNISLAVYARSDFFPDAEVSQFHLASRTQLMPFLELPEWLMRRLQVADDILQVNENGMLQALLCAGEGWAWLPEHMKADSWPGVVRVNTDMGNGAISQLMVALWKPGQLAPPVLSQLLAAFSEAWPAPD